MARSPSEPEPAVGFWRSCLVVPPSWLLSAAIHATLFVVLVLTIRQAPRGAASEATREVGVVLKRSTPEGERYEGESDREQPNNPEQASVSSASGGLGELADDKPPVDARQALPKGSDLIGIGAAEAGQITGALGFTQGPRQSTKLTTGMARTKLYGIEGTGYKFVYVFDRSASMGYANNSPLNSAKAQLLASLDSLGDTHQFQIIFYNQDPSIFPLAGVQGRLVFGNSMNKAAARRFVGGITADGATEHEPALAMGLRLQPDCLFFLTDADQPELSPLQLARLRRLNGGRTAIHCIEFGIGSGGNKDNFLVRLARENDGQYTYIDISQPGKR